MGDYRDNIGKKATDTATGITGTITGVWYMLGGTPKYMIEHMDKNGTGCSWWAEVSRVEVEGDICGS